MKRSVTEPDCMTPEEYAGWVASSERVRGSGRTPCVDCPAWFRREETSAGRCAQVPKVRKPHGPAPALPTISLRLEAKRRVNREYMNRIRAEQRAAEGRARYERRRVA